MPTVTKTPKGLPFHGPCLGQPPERMLRKASKNHDTDDTGPKSIRLDAHPESLNFYVALQPCSASHQSLHPEAHMEPH